MKFYIGPKKSFIQPRKVELFVTEPQEELLRQDLILALKLEDYTSWFYSMSVWGYNNGVAWRNV